jgi:hypothetical protein
MASTSIAYCFLPNKNELASLTDHGSCVILFYTVDYIIHRVNFKIGEM